MQTPTHEWRTFGLALAGVFGVVAAGLLVLGVLVSPVAVGVAIPFGAASALVWYHASGRLERRVRADARRRARARGRTRTRARGRRRRPGGSATRGGGGSGRARDAGARPGRGAVGSEAEAYRVLGLDPDATRQEVKRAYRERVKHVHPDRGGDEDEFRRVTAAYDRLSE